MERHPVVKVDLSKACVEVGCKWPRPNERSGGKEERAREGASQRKRSE